MSADEYVPSEDEVREMYVWLSAGNNEGAREQATEDFARFLARVRREAKAEAWDEGYDSGYQDHIDRAWDSKPGRNPYEEDPR